MKSFPFNGVMKETLRDLLAERALQIAPRGEWFTLSTGKKSKFFFNCKPVTLSSDGAELVADAFLEKIKLLPEAVTAVGGLSIGADPIVVSMMMRARQQRVHLDGFLVRAKQKDHGLKELVANAPKRGTRVVIVDDVVTSGGSTLEAIRAVKEIGCVIVGVVVLMDRLEDNGADNIRREVPHYHAVYTRHDFPEIGEAETWDTTTSAQHSARHAS
jgi:orotate phosphoribosyltransferase